ncbi:MAG: immunoglobulin domain-containing protein [Verrucomicrobia bacterium]|nr:immunoglobulin domain-containing protein [Verrucomicrobiota bacterium]
MHFLIWAAACVTVPLARAQVPTISGVSTSRQVVPVGQNLTLGATVAGATSYQWKRNGRAVVGATAANLVLTDVKPARDGGWYQLVAMNAAGSTTSAVVFVNVAVEPARLIGFGTATYGESVAPSGLTPTVTIAAGGGHSLALKADGTVVGWGRNDYGQASPPNGLGGVVAIAAGGLHSLALKSDGTVVAWGHNGLLQTAVPVGLGGVVSLAAGDAFSLALKADGTIVAWGGNGGGATTLPPALTGVVAIAAGSFHGLAAKADGTVTAWGNNSHGQATVPPGLSGVVALAAGNAHSVALKSDGTVAVWGANSAGANQLGVPAGLTDVVQIAAGFAHTIALRADGTTAGWGSNQTGQLTTPPAGTQVLGVASGAGHVMLLTLETVYITTQPAAQSVVSGGSATMSVAAGGSGPFTYQWRRNGVPITGATASSCTMANATRADTDFYDVVVANGAASAMSQPVRLTVAPTSYPGAVGIDPSYAVGVESRGAWVEKVLVLADGRVLIAGNFLRVNGVRTSGVARFKADLTIDPSFSAPLFEGSVDALALQSDGKILAGGRFARVAGQEFSYLARLNADGSLDTSFVFNAVSAAVFGVSALATLPDGKILVGGGGFLMRLHPDGRRDSTFSPASSIDVRAIVPLSNGDVLIAGGFDTIGSTPRAGVARLKPDGALDATFGVASGVNGRVNALVPLAGGKILIGGYFTGFGGTATPRYLRLNADGTRDVTFPGGTATYAGTSVNVIAVLDSGKILVGGWGDDTGTGLARLNADGTLDTLLAAPVAGIPNFYSFPGYVDAIAVLPDGTALVGGYFKKLGAAARDSVARLNADGSLAGTVTTTVLRRGVISSVLVDAAGRATIGGAFDSVDGTETGPLARVTATGAVDSSFALAQNVIGAATEIWRQADGKLLVRGEKAGASGAAVPTLVRFNANGSLDAGFAPGLAAGASPLAAALAPGGKILVAASRQSPPGTWRTDVFRLHADGSLDVSFDTTAAAGSDGGIHGLIADAGGRVLVTGGFTRFAGAERKGIARLNPDGSLDRTFDAGVVFGGSWVWKLAELANGEIVIPGWISDASGRSGALLVLGADGRVQSRFAPPADLFHWGLQGFMVQDDGRPLAWQSTGGYQDPFGTNRDDAAIVRLKNAGTTGDGSVDPSFSLSGLRPTDGISAAAMGDDGRLFFALGNTGRLHVTSAAVTPVVLAPPLSRTVKAGASTWLTVLAGGAPLPAYQWRKGGVAIAGATNPKLTITSAHATDAGNYDVVVTNSGGNATSAVAVVTVDSGASPTVAITSPVSGTSVEVWPTPFTSIPVQATPADSDGTIVQVQFFANGALFGTALAPPYAADFWPTAAGSYSLTAIATDNQGNTTTSAAVALVATASTASAVAITSPASGASLLSNTQTAIEAVAVAPPGRTIASVQFFANGIPISAPDTTAPYGVNWFAPSSAGSRSFTAVVTDSSGATATSAAVATTVTTIGPPYAGIGFPTFGSNLPIGVPVALQATATAVTLGAEIASVAFYVNGILVGSDSSFPYGIWFTPTAIATGVSITAIATDTFGNRSVPIPMMVNFVPPVGPTVAITAPTTTSTVVAGTATMVTAMAAAVAPGATLMSVSFFANGSEVGTRFSAPYSVSWMPVIAGTYELKARAYDSNFSSTLSAAVSITVSPGTAPSITVQPQGQALVTGGSATFGVTATGTGPITYQWVKDGVDILGATGATFARASVSMADAGNYAVIVTNAAGTVTSQSATLTVVPAGFSGLQIVAGAGYFPGRPVTIANTINYSGTLSSLGWHVLLPDGWSLASTTSGDVPPRVGDTSVLDWAWFDNIPPSGSTFTYTLNVPAGASSLQTIVSLLTVRQDVSQYALLARPDPLSLTRVLFHSADTTGAMAGTSPDGRIDLAELLRVIELYNHRVATVRTGQYTLQSGTDDGFTAGSGGATLTRFHSADTMGPTPGTPPDGKLNLAELLRVIELYNYRAGTVRTGQYRILTGTEDGFAPGP